jgi:glycogen operon protein
LEQGRAYPLGASWDGAGVNFALFSATAEVVELCLYAADGVTETARLPLRARTDEVWHGYFPGAGPGQLYGYRVHGPYDPGQGLRFNAHKLLLDPYARAWSRSFTPIDPADGHALGVNGGEPGFDQRDTGPAMVKAIVTGPDDFNWEEDHPPRTPWSETILYEAHVKGLTRLHPAVPEADRGRYLGLAHPAVTDHLRRLGVTAIELLPLMGMADEPFLRARGQVNYWGYNTLGFFLPDPRYAAADPRRELKTAIKALHAAGIEVILDPVVPGHRQPQLLSARSHRPEPLREPDRHRQCARLPASPGDPADHGFAPVVGSGIPCRRLPLRSRDGAGARAG